MQFAVVEETVYGLDIDLASAFRAHHAQVFRTAWRVTGSATDAEDALQTVFLRLLRREGTAPPDHLEAYLHRAAVNAALDIVRARRDSLPIEDVPSETHGAHHFDPGEVQECLRRGLATLAPQSAEVFVLRFIEGYSNTEIARMLSISQVRVAVIVHRARGKMQKEIGGHHGGRP